MGGNQFRRAVPGQNGRITGTRDQPIASGPVSAAAAAEGSFALARSAGVVRRSPPRTKAVAPTASYYQRHSFGTCCAVVLSGVPSVPVSGDSRERAASRRAVRMFF